MRSLIVALTILLLTSSLVLAEDQESARQMLEKNGIPFTEDEFVNRARKGDFSTIKLMLDAGMAADAKDRNGTPALIAVLFEGERKTKVVWSNGSYSSIWIRSPGVLKLYKESLEAAKGKIMEDPRILAMALALLDRGANPNASDKQGTTAIMYPAQEGNEEIAKVLLDKGADVNAKNAEGESALSMATENGHTAVAALLIENGADVNAKNAEGESALFMAAAHGHTAVAPLLIKNGADVNERNPDGLSILETAIDSGRPEMVKLLLAAGAELHPEVLVEHAENPGALSPESLGHMDRIKILETAVAILKSENVDKQNKIEALQNQVDKVVEDVFVLNTKTNPGLELLSGN